MSTVPSLPSPQPARPDTPALSLDERIRRAEARLVAREQSLHARMDTLRHRLHDAARAPRLIVSAIGVGLALFALATLLRDRRRMIAAVVGPRGAGRAAAQIAAGGAVPWAHLVALAWPLLPAAWRSRVSPTTAATLVSLGLPWLERVLASRAPRPALPTAPSVDLTRYTGTWYEIARLPAAHEAGCDGQPSAHYSLRGSVIGVFHHCRGSDGRERSALGAARVVPGSGNAKLRVTFAPLWLRWLPFVWTSQWVLHVDADYQVTVVGHPNRRLLWILSRRTQLPAERLAALIDFAADRGYAVQHLLVHPAARAAAMP